ncbi:MAG: hypothetical protein AB2687_01860 [Candidatus Thiodiazotropha taylori]
MSNTQINTVDSAYSTVLLCLETCADLADTAKALTHSVITQHGHDWGLEQDNWWEIRDSLSKALEETLQDHVRTPPKSILIETLGETLAKDEYRDQWEGLTVEELEEVWQGLADHLLLGHA